jgi:hypothetical protein
MCLVDLWHGMSSRVQALTGACLTLIPCMYAGWNWDYVFDWTILKYQRSNGIERPVSATAAAGGGGGGGAAGGDPGTQGQQQQQQQGVVGLSSAPLPTAAAGPSRLSGGGLRDLQHSNSMPAGGGGAAGPSAVAAAAVAEAGGPLGAPGSGHPPPVGGLRQESGLLSGQGLSSSRPPALR